MASSPPKPDRSWLDPIGDRSREADDLRVAQVVALARQTPWIAVVNLVNSALTMAIFWNLAPRGALVGWLALVWLGALTRLPGWLRNRARPVTQQASRRLVTRAIVGAALVGCLWGSAGLLFLVANTVAQQVFLAFVIGGMAAGAAAALAVLPAAAAAYIVPSLAPATFAFLSRGDTPSLVLAGMAVLYCAALLVFVHNSHATFVANLYSKFEKDVLLSELARSNDRLQAEIEKQEQGQRALEESEERLRAILDTAADAIISIDEQGVIESFNPAAERLFKYDAVEVIGEPLTMLIPQALAAEHDEQLARHLRASAGNGIGTSREVECRRKNHTVFPADITLGEVRLGERTLFTGILRDATERKRVEEEMKHLADHDSLTGLPGLRLGRDRLASAVAAARRHKEMTALLFLDLDGFKAVNDTYGHDAGDHLLKVVADRLKGCVRQSDTVGRVGGDEFIVVVTDMSGTEAATSVAEKIVAALARPIDYRNDRLAVGVSIGIAIYPLHGDAVDDLMERADEAMYAVKRSDKNSYRFASPPAPAERLGE